MIKIKLNYILSICAAALAVMCVASVARPISFGNERETRERAVKERLVQIRKAEDTFMRANGRYANATELTAARLVADSTLTIPFSDGERFTITTSVNTTKSGEHIPLMECGAKFTQYLNGLDEELTSSLSEEALKQGNYPGLKIGDIITPNNNAGNWE